MMRVGNLDVKLVLMKVKNMAEKKALLRGDCLALMKVFHLADELVKSKEQWREHEMVEYLAV